MFIKAALTMTLASLVGFAYTAEQGRPDHRPGFGPDQRKDAKKRPGAESDRREGEGHNHEQCRERREAIRERLSEMTPEQRRAALKRIHERRAEHREERGDDDRKPGHRRPGHHGDGPESGAQ